MSKPGDFRRGTAFKGKTVERFYANGFGIAILFTDGSTFEYDGSDGGYGSFDWAPPGHKDETVANTFAKTWEEFQDYIFGGTRRRN